MAYGRDDAVYVISVAAELAGMHPQTLRTYERKGLVEPRRTAGNTRRYSERDIEKLQLIQFLTQEQGLNLAGVEMVLDMWERLQQAQERAAAAEARLDELERQFQRGGPARDGRGSEIVPAPHSQIQPHPKFPRPTRGTARRGTGR